MLCSKGYLRTLAVGDVWDVEVLQTRKNGRHMKGHVDLKKENLLKIL